MTANYLPYVHEDENHGIGSIKPGHRYYRSEAFAMIMRSSLANKDEITNLIAKIPLFNFMFQNVIIE